LTRGNTKTHGIGAFWLDAKNGAPRLNVLDGCCRSTTQAATADRHNDSIETLFRRIPTLRLAFPSVQAAYKSDGLFFGLHSLPVAWQLS
jgi:hypothetical protein